MSSTAIPSRADISESDKWDLMHLFADVSKWQEDFAWLQREYPKLEQWKGRVGESAQTLAAVLEFEKALELKMERVYHYASLQVAEDSTNNEYLARIGQVQNLLTKIAEAAAFVVPEILAIDDERFAKFIADPALKDWRIRLQKVRRMKPHVLSVAEERLLALSNVALSGYDDTFSQLTDVDMKFGVLIDETGRERPLTQSSFSSFLVKRDRELRKRAFHQFYAEFRDHQYTLAASLA
jgi:oligoendopeptidase F